jgi:hypothetical protein
LQELARHDFADGHRITQVPRGQTFQQNLAGAPLHRIQSRGGSAGHDGVSLRRCCRRRGRSRLDTSRAPGPCVASAWSLFRWVAAGEHQHQRGLSALPGATTGGWSRAIEALARRWAECVAQAPRQTGFRQFTGAVFGGAGEIGKLDCDS